MPVLGVGVATGGGLSAPPACGSLRRRTGTAAGRPVRGSATDGPPRRSGPTRRVPSVRLDAGRSSARGAGPAAPVAPPFGVRAPHARADSGLPDLASLVRVPCVGTWGFALVAGRVLPPPVTPTDPRGRTGLGRRWRRGCDRKFRRLNKWNSTETFSSPVLRSARGPRETAVPHKGQSRRPGLVSPGSPKASRVLSLPGFTLKNVTSAHPEGPPGQQCGTGEFSRPVPLHRSSTGPGGGYKKELG